MARDHALERLNQSEKKEKFYEDKLKSHKNFTSKNISEFELDSYNKGLQKERLFGEEEETTSTGGSLVTIVVSLIVGIIAFVIVMSVLNSGGVIPIGELIDSNSVSDINVLSVGPFSSTIGLRFSFFPLLIVVGMLIAILNLFSVSRIF